MHLIDCIVSVVSKNRLQNHYSRVSQPLSTFNNQMCWFLTTGFRSFHFKFCLTAWRKSETDILSSRLATNKRQRQYYFFSSFNYGFKELSQTACDSKEHLLTSLRSQFKITYSVCSFLLGIFSSTCIWRRGIFWQHKQAISESFLPRKFPAIQYLDTNKRTFQ